MTGLEALQTVRYAEAKGQRFAILRYEDWETLVEWLEDLEDLHAARRALADLKEHGDDPERAGWLRWDDVKDQL